jgi:hypothetical protein
MLLIEFHMSLRPVRAQGHVTIFCIPRLTTLVFRDVSRGGKKIVTNPWPCGQIQSSRWRAKKSPCGCSLRFFSHQKRSGSRPVILTSRFANYNCYNSKTSTYFYYKIVIFSFPVSSQRLKDFYWSKLEGPRRGI